MCNFICHKRIADIKNRPSSCPEQCSENRNLVSRQNYVLMKPIPETDLILNPDGSIYHLNLLPEDVAPTVITVGDPARVLEVSKHFDRIELMKGKREFLTHTGYVGNNRITVISTGIGTDNIDIVINELDALVNIDFSRRLPKPVFTSLDIIRIGTSGSIQPDIETGSILISEYGMGLDALMHYYIHDLDGDERELQEAAHSYFHHLKGISPYVASAARPLIGKFEKNFLKGVTVTTPGFYAPQGRKLRARTSLPDFVDQLSGFRSGELRLTNLEMETTGIYALAKALGHRAVSVNAILGNRLTMDFTQDADSLIGKTIEKVFINL